jgi:Domain of unknown function (DUF4783)
MKQIIRLFLFIPLLVLLASFQKAGGLEDVLAAIRSGNAESLSKNFDNMMDLTLPGKSNSYSKSQAEVIMRDFFSTNTVKGFEVKHRGDNNNSSIYCIGDLITRNGAYRMTLYLKQKGDRQLLQEIKIETK